MTLVKSVSCKLCHLFIEIICKLVFITLLYRSLNKLNLQSGMADSYINRKKKREKVHYEHIELKPILEETYGVILYQEQVMKISQVIGNLYSFRSRWSTKSDGKKDQREDE